MPLHLTHNHFGDYTPLARTPAGFKSPSLGGKPGFRHGLDELHDRPHFGVEETSTGPSFHSPPLNFLRGKFF